MNKPYTQPASERNHLAITANSDVSAAIAAGTALAAKQEVDGNPFLTVPSDYKVEDLERFRDWPNRRRGLVQFADAGSFIRYVKEEIDALTRGGDDEGILNKCRIYGRRTEAPAFKAVLNDHGHTAGWGDHIASYQCPVTVEWAKWTKNNGVVMTQTAFATFIEDNAPDCVLPPSAEMIEIARSIEAKKSANFTKSIRLADGSNEFSYEETIDATAGKGKFSVPDVFTLGIKPLDGLDAFELQARLRYRIASGGVLSMWYDLVRPHKVMEAAVNDVWKQIEEGTGLTIFHGVF